MHYISYKQRRFLRWLLLSFLIVLLAACSTTPSPQLDVNPDTTTDFAYVASVDISADDTQAEIEAKYGGRAFLFNPEAGFAMLGFSEEGAQLTTLATSANQDALTSPEASAMGFDAWAGGFDAWAGGWDAWAGGWDAWAGGWDAWAGGHGAWSGGDAVPALPSGNETAWQQINLYDAHAASKYYGAGIKVAVIDTGVDLNHPMLEGRLAPPSEWKDFIDGDSYPQEVGNTSNAGYGHGTAVAGIIAQVAPGATLLPLRVLDKDGKGDLDDVVSAIDWAVQKGADIINLSLGSNEYYWPLEQIIDYATQNKVMIVTSSGNEASSTATYPAQMVWWQNRTIFSYLHSVGSLNSNNTLSSFSNRSNLSYAPGENIITAFPGNRTAKTSGTSFATPIYAGTLALALSEHPTNDPANLFIYMGNTADWPANYNGEAYGMLDAAGLVKSAQGQAGQSLIGEGWLHNWVFWDWQTNASIIANGYDSKGGKITGQGGFGQIITGLKPNTTYRFTGFIKVDNANHGALLGVKNYGGAEIATYQASTSYKWTQITFTTGPNSTSAEVYLWKNSTTGNAYGDQFWFAKY